jgi:hypothetical protein
MENIRMKIYDKMIGLTDDIHQQIQSDFNRKIICDGEITLRYGIYISAFTGVNGLIRTELKNNC